MPAGLGQDVKIVVFSGEEYHDEVLAAGCDIIGTDAILKEISEGVINFDKIIATKEQVPQLKQFARILGPKGLMPNVKSGTLVKSEDLASAVKDSKAGMVEFRVDEQAIIKTKFGLRNFTNEALETNLDALMRSIGKKRPESVKGKYFGRALVKTSMGPTIKMNTDFYHELSKPQ